jgi:hypothetical protein
MYKGFYFLNAKFCKILKKENLKIAISLQLAPSIRSHYIEGCLKTSTSRSALLPNLARSFTNAHKSGNIPKRF